MVLWVEKYRPHTLDKLDLHSRTSEILKQLITCGDLPHLMFYGPSGAGKSTRVTALLRAAFGPGVEKVKVTHKAFKVGNKNIECTTSTSNYHIELNPSESGNNDTHVIQHVISEIAQTQGVNLAANVKGGDKESGEEGGRKKPNFKVVVLREVDRLSKQAQQALRRTMEKYTTTCRLIMVCESACRVIPAVRSRVLPVRVSAPTHVEICKCLQHVASKENITLPHELAARISERSNRNLRRAILMLEAAKVKQYPFAPNQIVALADWEGFIDELGKLITEEQSPGRLHIARNKMYELLINCIPPEIIIKTLTNVLLKRMDDQIKHEVVRWSAHYEHRMQLGSKPIFHLEAFVAKFMAIYKRWVIEMFG